MWTQSNLISLRQPFVLFYSVSWSSLVRKQFCFIVEYGVCFSFIFCMSLLFGSRSSKNLVGLKVMGWLNWASKPKRLWQWEPIKTKRKNKTVTFLFFLYSHFFSLSVSQSLDLILYSPASPSRASVVAAPATAFGSLTFSSFFFSGSFSILSLDLF